MSKISFQLNTLTFVSGAELHRVRIAEVFSLGRVCPLEGQVYQILLAVAQFFQLGKLCIGRSLVRVPLDQEEVFCFHPVVQPEAVRAQQIIQMIHLFAVRQAKTFLCVEVSGST